MSSLQNGISLRKPRLRGLLAACVLVCLAFFAAPAARAQETVASIRETAFRYWADGEFADALPFFENLIQIQGASKQTQIVAALERVYYYAAMCKFLTGDFSGAITSFERYNAKYKHGIFLHESYVYIADAYRYSNKLDQAIRQYNAALKRFSYPTDIRTDIYASIARCYLAQDDWDHAIEPLKKAFATAPDYLRRNRAATLLATAYLKTMNLEEIYLMVPYLLTRDSLASRSIAFNMAALEAGDTLFGEERYREAFWIHRLIYPYDDVLVNTESYLERLKAMVAATQRYTVDPRRLMRLQEWIADAEGELKALQEGVENYDPELFFRIARGYMEAKRYREGCELFLYINANGGEDHAEESLYLAFFCATQLKPYERAHKIARKYMDEYPSGNWYEVLTLIDGQLYAADKDWKAVIRHFSEVLQSHPQHQSAAECLYLLGYAHFMEEEFEQSRVRLMEIREKYPQSDLMPDAIYWCAMDSIFDGDFETGEKDFTELLDHFPGCRYFQDATYRRGVCSYALGNYDLAEERLGGFVRDFPQNENVNEANMTRADVAGAVGRLDDAVALYRSTMDAMDNAPTNVFFNIEHYNHCAFQAGQILFDSEKYDDVIDHFTHYIKINRPESNIPLACYWIGRSRIQKGDPVGAMQFYRDAVLRFGKDRLQVGVDMILDEWVATSRKLNPAQQKAMWDDVGYVIMNAKNARDPVSALRFERLYLYQPGISDGERERILDKLCQPGNLTNASPAVLETMLDTAKVRGQTNLAIRVATAIIKDFTETDYALDARAFLADAALAQAAGEPPGSERADKLYAGAIRNLTVIREVYATAPEAAGALVKLGEIYTKMGKTAEADECYKDVLGVRDWRPIWPQALLGRGACAEKKGDYLKAAAYYERIYVMYSGYRAITAKAYLKRAQCLRRGYEHNKAAEVLRAMLANEDLKAFPEYAEAQHLLGAMGKAGE